MSRTFSKGQGCSYVCMCVVVLLLSGLFPGPIEAGEIDESSYTVTKPEALGIGFTYGSQSERVKHGKKKKTTYSYKRFYDVKIANSSDTDFIIKKLEIETRFGVQEIESKILSKAWGTIIIPAGGHLIEKDRWFSVENGEDWPVLVTDTYYLESSKTGEKFAIISKVRVGEQ